jgi:hypothetical protein
MRPSPTQCVRRPPSSSSAIRGGARRGSCGRPAAAASVARRFEVVGYEPERNVSTTVRMREGPARPTAYQTTSGVPPAQDDENPALG